MTPPKTQTMPQYNITDADKVRVQKIADAWKAYHGDLEKPLKRMPDQPDDNVMSNRCQPIVDRGVDFLFGKFVEIQLEEGAPQDAQEAIESVWGKHESRIPLLQKLAMSGAICGQAFVRIVPSKSGDEFRLVVVNPATVYVQTDPQDVDVINLYCIQFSEYTNTSGVKYDQVFYREEMQRVDNPADDPDDNTSLTDQDAYWVINHWSKVGERGQWVSAGDPIVWPYAFAPIFSCQNLPYPHEFWGMPDVTPDLIGMNNALNLVQSNINRVGKIYGQPVIYATGVGETVIDIIPGKIIGLPTPDSKIESVAISSDSENALDFANTLRQDMDEQSAVPAVALGRQSELKFGQLSGTALELMFLPLTEKTEKKRCLYGKLIIDVTTALLIMMRYSPDIEVHLAWQSALPKDDQSSIQAALGKKQIGVSDQTLVSELGYDWDEEQERSQAEDAVKLAAFNRGNGMPQMQAAQNAQQQQEQQGEVE